MREPTCWRLFSYLAIDYKAAQAELDRMAAEGWALERIHSGVLARFRRTDRTDLRYFLDWTDAAKPEEHDYLQLCTEAGWELVETVGYLNIYASRPGTDPLPIQTDPALEYLRYRKKVLRRMLLADLPLLIPLLLILLLAIVSWMRTPSVPALLPLVFAQSNLVSAILLTFPLPLVLLLLRLLWSGRHFCSWKKAAGAGEALPVPEAAAARRRGRLSLASAVYSTLLLPFLTADILLNDTNIYAFAGMLLGGVCLMVRHPDDKRILRRSLLCCGLALFFLLCGWAHGPLRDAFPGRIPPAPVLEGGELDVFHGDQPTRSDTFLGSRARWSESFLIRTRGSTSDYTSVCFTVHTWVSPFLAGRDRTAERAQGVPAEGYEAVWRVSSFSDRWHAYLCRRGNTWLTLEFTDNLASDPLPAALAWLEGWTDETTSIRRADHGRRLGLFPL